MQRSAEAAPAHTQPQPRPSTTLERILAGTRRQVSAQRSTADYRQLEAAAAAHTPRGFRKALQQRALTGPAIIAELKKASPSKGLIRPNFAPAALAAELAAAGATALSVLTDVDYFQGSLANLRAASAAVPLPCLRKDFMVSEFQMLEARAHGADAILLIVAALSDADLRTLAASARRFELDILCEVHDEAELARALDAGLDDAMLGVNNRNLHTFETTLETSLRLAELMPAPSVRVAESGIATRADIATLRAAGYHAFLIGESLMRQPSPGAALRELLG
jgi:indole-3-glycerol phosphate synthase